MESSKVFFRGSNVCVNIPYKSFGSVMGDKIDLGRNSTVLLMSNSGYPPARNSQAYDQGLLATIVP